MSASTPTAKMASDVLSALLPDQDGQHDATHAEDGEDGAHDIEGSGSGVRRVLDQLDARQDDAQ